MSDLTDDERKRLEREYDELVLNIVDAMDELRVTAAHAALVALTRLDFPAFIRFVKIVWEYRRQW